MQIHLSGIFGRVASVSMGKDICDGHGPRDHAHPRGLLGDPHDASPRANQMASELDRTRLDARTRALLEGPILSTLLRLATQRGGGCRRRMVRADPLVRPAPRVRGRPGSNVIRSQGGSTTWESSTTRSRW